tara:strand:+ start:118 stop:558 length:441 start_codon:yes stop_codon:yes gene_type:complete
MIKSFRGKIAHNGQERIRLSTNKGEVGYQIRKFEIIGTRPDHVSQENTVMIFKTFQTTSTGDWDIVDLGNPDLLAVAYRENGNAATNNEPATIIFDIEVFNQDIYITHMDGTGSDSCNYYIEMEVIKLSVQQAEYATIKDIRSNKS